MKGKRNKPPGMLLSFSSEPDLSHTSILYYLCLFQLTTPASAVSGTTLIKPIPNPPVSSAPMIASVFLNLDVSIESLYNWFNIGCSQLKVLSIINAAGPCRYRCLPLEYYRQTYYYNMSNVKVQHPSKTSTERYNC